MKRPKSLQEMVSEDREMVGLEDGDVMVMNFSS